MLGGRRERTAVWHGNGHCFVCGTQERLIDCITNGGKRRPICAGCLRKMKRDEPLSG